MHIKNTYSRFIHVKYGSLHKSSLKRGIALVKKLTSRKGITPILATLLLIAIAVGAVIIAYAWVITFTTTQTQQTGAVLGLENIRFPTNTTIEVIIRNSGTADAQIATVYMGTTSANLASVSQTDLAYVPPTKIVSAGSSINITITYPWASGTTYYFKVVTEAGQQVPFNQKAP